jgi:GNAT superfamily N-acetyltransferase
MADLPAIQQFIRLTYGPLARFKAEPRWLWQFINNPSNPFDDRSAPVWIAVADTAVVGQIAVQPTKMKIGDSIYQGGWIVDVMILPSFRGLGLGHRLHEAVAQRMQLLVMLTMAPATRRIADRAGSITLDDAWQYSRVCHVEPSDISRYVRVRLSNREYARNFLEILLKVPGVCRLVAALTNGFVGARDLLRRLPSTDGTMTEVRVFGPEFDQFWQTIGRRFPALTVRDSRYLDWRFVQCPNLRYRSFALTIGKAIRGYVVLRRTETEELRQGIISDLVAAPGDVQSLRTLLVYALIHFGKDVASVECVTSSEEIRALLREFGFIRTRTTRPTCWASEKNIRREIEQLRSSWYFTKSDHDWDQVQIA